MKLRNVLWIIFLSGCTALFGGSRPNFYIHTGISRPLVGPDEFKDSYRTGVNFGVMVGKQLASKFELVGELAIHNCTFSSDKYANTRTEENIDEFTITGDPATVIAAFAKAKWIIPAKGSDKAISYFYAGPGLFYMSTQDVVGIGPTEAEDFTVPGRSETVLGICGGLGFEYTIETTTLFLELGIAGGLTKDETTFLLPLKFGIAIK
jgi:hypothetical protein